MMYDIVTSPNQQDQWLWNPLILGSQKLLLYKVNLLKDFVTATEN